VVVRVPEEGPLEVLPCDDRDDSAARRPVFQSAILRPMRKIRGP